MDSEPLTAAEKKKLRGIGQRLKPHVHLGKQGLTETVQGEIDMALTKNGLIKIRFDADRDTIKTLCQEIQTKTDSELVGNVGKTAVFFRDMPEEASAT